MDSNGITTIDFIFTIFLTLIISITIFNFIGNNLENQITLEDELNMRIVTDDVANTINQVNSNNLGHLQEITIQNNISKRFSITISSNKVLFDSSDRKAESTIFPILLANVNNDIVGEIKLYPGETYKIKKTLNEKNQTVIQIFRI